jgi:hypothetical protein
LIPTLHFVKVMELTSTGMDSSMHAPHDSAPPVNTAQLPLSQRLQNDFADLIALVQDFQTRPVTPAAKFALEKMVADRLSEIERHVIADARNHAKTTLE